MTRSERPSNPDRNSRLLGQSALIVAMYFVFGADSDEAVRDMERHHEDLQTQRGEIEALQKRIEELEKERIVLTTYGMIAKRKPKNYKSPLWKPHWGRLIFDEAHHLRNCKTSICNGAFKLTADIKWMVTGTPIQNRKSDIKILFGLLGRIVRGEKDLKECISRYLLRRTKKGVGINIEKL